MVSFSEFLLLLLSSSSSSSFLPLLPKERKGRFQRDENLSRNVGMGLHPSFLQAAQETVHRGLVVVEELQVAWEQRERKRRRHGALGIMMGRNNILPSYIVVVVVEIRCDRIQDTDDGSNSKVSEKSRQNPARKVKRSYATRHSYRYSMYSIIYEGTCRHSLTRSNAVPAMRLLCFTTLDHHSSPWSGLTVSFIICHHVLLTERSHQCVDCWSSPGCR